MTDAGRGTAPAHTRKRVINIPDSEAKKAWIAANTTRVAVKLNNHTDADVLQRLSEVDSKQGYIKKLIREDIARSTNQQQ